MKILAVDIDGTLVDSKGHISAVNLDALARARDAGNMIVFVTGRREIENSAINDQCRTVADYFLFNMGGHLVRASDSKVFFDQFVHAPSAKTLVEACLDNDWQLNIFGARYWAVNKWTDALREYLPRAGATPLDYRSIDDVPYSRLQSMMATHDANPIAAFLNDADLEIDFVDSEPGCIDILPKGLNKWQGIEALLELVGASPKQVIAIGDYDSDVPMFEKAGIAVAVANAREVAKAAADYVTTADCHNDAVAQMIDDLVLGVRPGLCVKTRA